MTGARPGHTTRPVGGLSPQPPPRRGCETKNKRAAQRACAQPQQIRGDADGRTPDDYVAGLKKAGALNVVGDVLPDSGEFAPLEVPQAFMQALAAFAAQCRNR